MDSLIQIVSTLFGLFVAAKMISGEIFSSMADMEALIGTEKIMLGILRDLLEEEQEKVRVAQLQLQQVKTAIAQRGKKRFGTSFSWFGFGSVGCLDSMDNDGFPTTLLNSHAFLEAKSAVDAARHSSSFPSEQDVSGAAEAFHRLQQTYRIPTKAIIDGQIPGTRPSIPFNYEEILLVGQELALAGHYNNALVWMETVFDYITNDPDFSDESLYVTVLDWLQFSAYHSTNNTVRALNISKEIKALRPDYKNVDENLKDYGDAIANLTVEEIVAMENYVYARDDFTTEKYEALCRGEHQNDSQNLRCFLTNYSNPYLYLQPVKLEELHGDPKVFAIHNAILPSQADRIKARGHLVLQRGKVLDGEEEFGVVSNSRIAKIAFLGDDFDPVVAEVNRYAGLATNLDEHTAEPLQINNYGIGGLYLPHWDYFGGEANAPNTIYGHLGDRIATLLFYMTDVEAGGATVFPELNLTLFAEKGTAAFWYNLHPDGSTDRRTMHSGCPVLSGIKWVSNKWFREAGQDRRRPCELVKNGDPPENKT